MNAEIELRIYDINKKELIEKLTKCGGKLINNYDQIRYIYDFNPICKNKWIRLRTDGFKNTLTIKEHINDSITGTKELEIEVSDFKKTDLILEELGYRKRSIQENKRTKYILDEVEIDIDSWPYLKDFVEFEASTKEKIYKVLEKLGFKKSDTTTKIAQDFYYDIGFTDENMNNLKFEED